MAVYVDSPWFGFDVARDPPHLRRSPWFWVSPDADRASGEACFGSLRIVWNGKRKKYEAPDWLRAGENSEPDLEEMLGGNNKDKSIVAGIGRLGFTWGVIL